MLGRQNALLLSLEYRFPLPALANNSTILFEVADEDALPVPQPTKFGELCIYLLSLKLSKDCRYVDQVIVTQTIF